ncbi:S-layer homology domain-containing protein [Desulfosporosinus youngiae]|uniref:Putative S-layer protein n=1 Tax=Desulfosporosinus youngiae DSM 17734 TaxID=768710 RepID=H5XZA8_9FIRM|nr:putative S-layer protein [Desulfosporosinus youngiae DSM 17734]
MVKKIRPLNIMIALMLLLQVTIYPASALGSEKANITVEEAVRIVKDNFTIPAEYSRMHTSYNEYNKRATYSLNWNSDQPPGGSFYAEVDATNGDILNMGQWQGKTQPSLKLPLLSAAEAEKTAANLVSKLAKQHQAELQLVKDEQQILSLSSSQPFTYNFRWNRMVNDIPFPGNGVTVAISGADGQIINYSYTWSKDLDFPQATDIISPEQAKQVFTDTPMLELQYYVPPIMDPQTSEPQQVLLVYQPSNDFYGGAIDALTGKPVTLGGQEVAERSSSTAATQPAKASASSTVQPASDQDTTQNSGQISQAEAINIIKKAIKIPSSLVLQSSNHSPDWRNPGEQVWNIQWNTDPAKTNEHLYFSARVNARTGDLIGLNQSLEGNLTGNSKPISRKDAQKIAEDFLKRIQPERFQLVSLRQESYAGKMPDNLQMFYYVRHVNGIPVASDGIRIAINALSKEVFDYDLAWTNSQFPNSSEVIPIDKATEKFLQLRPLTLNYTLIYPPGEEQPEVHLAYQPKTNSIPYLPSMLDAQTGNPMDVFGKTQSQWAGPRTFTDIQGNYAEKEIGIIGLTGAFGEYGESFHPAEKITVGSFLQAMLTAEGTNLNLVLSDEIVLKTAKERGWLQEDMNPGSELSRTDLSKIMIRYLGMDASAKAKNIYTVPFKDLSTIQPDALGYIALAWGLGILHVDGDNLQPNQTVTRADAAYALVHAYAVDRPANPYLR